LTYLGYSPLADDLHPARPKDELNSAAQDQPKGAEEPSGEISSGVDPSKSAPTPPTAEPAKPVEDKKEA